MENRTENEYNQYIKELETGIIEKYFDIYNSYYTIWY